jgi:hypothetical protein
MPLSWAVKVSKDTFRKVNGFPNNMAKGGANEAFENRLRIAGIPVYTPTARPMIKAPKKDQTTKVDAGGGLVVDALQWRFDGVQTLQYAVTKIQVGDWTVKPPTTDANVRTVTVRLTPDVEVADLPQKKLQEEKDDEVGKGRGEPSLKEIEGGADEDEEPEHLKTMELAYVHSDNHAAALGGARVVNVLDDEVHVGHSDELPFLLNQQSISTDLVSDVKKISVAF